MEGPQDPRRGNLTTLLAVVLLLAAAYSIVSALQHARMYQRCLASGYANCVDFALHSNE